MAGSEQSIAGFPCPVNNAPVSDVDRLAGDVLLNPCPTCGHSRLHVSVH